MSYEKRRYEIVVFGASGVTGKYVIQELALYHKGVNWCIAGRNRDKLQYSLKEISDDIKKNLDDIDILEADIGSEDSIAAMCRSTTLLLNCVGPYRFSGEKIAEQCVKYKTHCIDVSGEPQFLETVQLKYFKKAQRQGVYIVGSCGFDSIPCDVGIEEIRKHFKGDLSYLESYISIKQPPESTVNFGTWQSAIHGLAHAHELKYLRKSLKDEVFNKTFPKPEKKLKAKGNLFYSSTAGGWCIPFIGSDKSVIARTQMYNFQFKNERPVQVQTYMKPYSFFTAIATLIMGGIFMLMTKFALGRDLLEKFPEVFSLGTFSRNPSPREKPGEGSFKVIFNGKGWNEKLADPLDRHTVPPDSSVTAVLSGPDPAYISTAICFVAAALVILREKEKLPLNGGVFTPGAAFSNTTLMQKLEERGMKLTIEQK